MTDKHQERSEPTSEIILYQTEDNGQSPTEREFSEATSQTPQRNHEIKRLTNASNASSVLQRERKRATNGHKGRSMRATAKESLTVRQQLVAFSRLSVLTEACKYTTHMSSVMKEPTPKQQEVLDYIRDELSSGRPTPCVREMRDHFKLNSTRAVCDRLDALERKKCITRERGKARSIRIVGNATEHQVTVEVPILGHIPAGVAIDAEEMAEGTLCVGVETLGFEPTEKTFALVVHGDSMVGRGILDGDKVIVDGKREARNGDMVAALIDQECSLKTFVKDKKGSFLKPENPAYGKLMPVDDLQIQGVARALIRTLV